MSIFSLAMVFVVDKKVGMDKVVENQMALPPKQAAARPASSGPARRANGDFVKINRVMAYASPL